MADPTRPLDVARAEVRRRLFAAEERGDWPEAAVLAPLADVADMVCRIGDHRESTHYRAEKAGPLLASAIGLQVACLSNYAGDDEAARDALEAAGEVLEAVGQAVRGAMWALAGARRGAVVDADDLRQLRTAASTLSAWAEGLGRAPSTRGPVDPSAAGRSGVGGRMPHRLRR